MSINYTKPVLVRRVISSLIDYFLVFLFFMICLFIYSILFTLLELSSLNISPYLFFLIWFFLLVFCEYKFNCTIGKKITGLRTVNFSDNKEPNFLQICKRRLLDPFDIFLLGIVSIIILSQSETKQRFGDKFANTLVVDKEIYFDKTLK